MADAISELQEHEAVNDLFDLPSAHFDGNTYVPNRDYVRLRGQMLRVFECMQDGKWRTLDGILASTGDYSHASVSARLRDLRKEKFGAHTVERRYRDNGLHEYRLIVNGP